MQEVSGCRAGDEGAQGGLRGSLLLSGKHGDSWERRSEGRVSVGNGAENWQAAHTCKTEIHEKLPAPRMGSGLY